MTVDLYRPVARQAWANLVRRAASAALMGAIVLGAAPSPARGASEQPDTIHALVRSMAFSFMLTFTPDECLLIRSSSADELRERDPELYRAVTRRVGQWTDSWLESVAHEIATIPPERLNERRRQAAEINVILRMDFDSHGWPFTPTKVVFLPQRLFHDRTDRSSLTRGLVIKYYPGAFFATVDPSAPIAEVLIHETLHLNKHGRSFGPAFREGLTELATRRLVVEHELLSAKALRREDYYVDERIRVEAVLDAMVERTGTTRDEALDTLLGAYLTGDQGRMVEIFGEATWEALVHPALAVQPHRFQRERAVVR